MSLELGLGQGVHGWGRGGVQELDLKEDLALTCRLFPLPSDTTHQQRGVPGLQCEPGAGTSLRMELGVGSTASGSGPEPTVCPPPPQASTERVLRAGKQLHRHLLATCQNLIRDRKYHLRLYR